MARSKGFSATVDELLLARARRREPEALEQLYRLFSRPVFTLGCRLSGSAVEGEEILQESFLEMIRSIRRFRGDGPFGAWLRSIVVSKALMKIRRDRVRRLEGVCVADETFSEPGRAPARRWDTRRDLERALAQLTHTGRVVVWLHDVEGMTHHEIARLFDRSESFSKSQLSRAHARLRRWLSDEGRVPDASRHERAAGAAGR
jgi:RNA polymerase sigma-70 factor (ECF subfamily)